MPLRYERPRHPRVWGVQWARAVRRHADAQTSRQPHAPTGNRRVRGTDTRKTIRTFLLLGTATAILSGARCVRAQPGATAAPKVLFSEDFENGLPGNWEGAPLLSEGLPAGSTGAACAKPGEDIKSNHAWADGHFTVEDGLYFNYWARFDSAQWYQAFVFCKAKGQEAKDRSLYEAEPPVFNDTDWHLVSIPFADFKATMGPNQGNSPKPGEVCWTYFWSFQKRNLGMAVDKVWVTKGKRGVNRVRFHGNFTPKEGQALAETDKDEREQLWRLVAAMKPEGLYTTFSPYWAASSRVKPAMGVLDSGGEVGNHGLLFFDAKLQAAYKSWLKQVLTEKNPHTGLPLAQDPALAIIQLQNEDSLLFWTSQGTKGAAAAELRRQFAKYLDENAKTIRSVTGELTWDYANGVCTLNAPKAQGVTGFLSKGGTFKLADVEIRSGNEYASVLAVSMDDQPLSNSGKTLVQVGTTERPPGWKTRPVDSAVEKETRKGELVLNFGTKPWQIVEGEVALTIANPSLKAAHVLDANGMSVKDVPLEAAGGGKRLTFPPDAMCVVVE